MAQTMVSFRMDEDLKKSMEQTCKDMGMSMSTAFTLFAKKVTKEQRIPFEISVESSVSDSNMQYLKRLMLELAEERKHRNNEEITFLEE